VTYPRLAIVIALLLACGAVSPRTGHAQEVPLEYRVKAAYLANFVRFVEWPPAAAPGPITICVAGDNPFGTVLLETVAGERVNGREIGARVIEDPEPGCHVLFVPRTVAAAPFLRAAQAVPTLTVGETNDFLESGGLVTFVREGSNVRFVIAADAAARAGVRISSRLLRLARIR
jgi:hypothetical protein